MWDNLSIKEKAKIIDLSIKQGINSLSLILKLYNSYARGGYLLWKNKIKEHKNIDIDNDDTYDYEGFYNDNPDIAWDMLNLDSDAHFTDKYKTATHPTFSNLSIYSGNINKYNPRGIIGGTWHDDTQYLLSLSLMDNEWDTDRTLDYLRYAESNYVLFLGPDKSIILPSVTVTPNSTKSNVRSIIEDPLNTYIRNNFYMPKLANKYYNP